jgi:hypothetical protein
MGMITIYKDIKETKDANYITVDQALDRIQNGRSKHKVLLLHGTKDKKERAKIKATLPSVCFSGKFTERKDECLVEHSGFVVLDFDDVKDVQDKKNRLLQDDYIYSCWVSPSGNGLKALVKIPKKPELHEGYYLALLDRFPELDSTSKNLSRVCYESYDEEIYINKGSQIWTNYKESEVKEVLPQAEYKQTDYSKVNDVLNVLRRAKDGTKHENLLKASKLAGGFIRGGEMKEEEITQLLLKEVKFKGADDLELAKKTISDGIEYGKNEPISDVLSTSNNDFSILSDREAESEWLKLARENRIPQGLDIGSSHFDKHYRLKPRTLTGVFGIDNVGKSTFKNFMDVCYGKRHNVSALYFCRENEAASMRQNIIELYNGKPLHEQSKGDYDEAENFSYERFDLITNLFDVDLDNFLKVCDKAYSKKHYFTTFIDPYNAIQFEQSPKKNYEFLNSLRDYQNQMNMSFHISMHISTEKARNYVYSDEDSITDFTGAELSVRGQSKVPRKNFVEGGQPIANKLDDIIIVHRLPKVFELKSYTLVSVDKVKEYKTGGGQTFEHPIMFKKSDNYNTFIDSNHRNPLTGEKEIIETPFSILPTSKEF